jgi:putative two-component system response regulator
MSPALIFAVHPRELPIERKSEQLQLNHAILSKSSTLAEVSMQTANLPVTVLIISSESDNLFDICKILEGSGYTLASCADPDQALSMVRDTHFDGIVVNIGKQGAVGMDILTAIRQISAQTPFIILSSDVTVDLTMNALRTGVFDFIIMPCSDEQLLRSVNRAITNRRQKESEKHYMKEIGEKLKDVFPRSDEKIDMEIVHRFAALAEFRDPNNLAHNVRMGHYCHILARALSLPRDIVEAISIAAPLHDIGKACMPDSILLKEGLLTKVEADLMKSHTSYGQRILMGCGLPDMETAASIALTHHERWNGTGYPGGLKATDIPIEGRIANLCDQYDTLRSARPYKQPKSHGEAFAIITKGDGRTLPQHFDPGILALFSEHASAFDAIFELNMPARAGSGI